MDTRTDWRLVLLLWAAGLGAAGQFAKISVIFPQLALLYPEAGAGLGFLVSLISFLGIGLGLFAGLLVNRFGPRRLLIGALLTGAAISVAQAALPPFPLMLASRVIEGASHLTIVVAAPTLIGQIAAPRNRPLAMSLWSTFFGVAFAVTAWFGVPLVDRTGPAALFIAHAVWMLASAAALARGLPASSDKAGAPLPRFSAIVSRHLRAYGSARIAAPAAGWLAYTLTYVSVLTVIPAQLPPDARSLAAGIMPLSGIVVAMTLGVWLLRRFAPVSLVMVGFALAALCALANAIWPGNAVLPIALIGALGLVQGASFAAIPALNALPEDQAIANGAMAQMGNLGNTLGTPLLLALTGAFGPIGLTSFLLASYLGGIALHLILAARRSSQDI